MNELKWISTFNTIRNASSAIGLSEKIVQRYRDKSVLCHGIYIFTSKPLEKKALKLILEKNFFVFLYQLNPEGQIIYIRSFNSVVLAAKELNINKRIIYQYLKQGILFRHNEDTWVLSEAPDSSTLPSLDKLHKISLTEKYTFGKKGVYSKSLSPNPLKREGRGGKSIFVYTQACEEKEKIDFLGEFITQKKAALAAGCSTLTVARCLNSRKILQRRSLKILFSYSFLPLPQAGSGALEGIVNSNFKNLFELPRKNHPSTKPVFIYIKKEGGLEFSIKFESIREASLGMEISCSPQTIANYLDKGLLYKNKFLFSTTLINT